MSFKIKEITQREPNELQKDSLIAQFFDITFKAKCNGKNCDVEVHTHTSIPAYAEVKGVQPIIACLMEANSEGDTRWNAKWAIVYSALSSEIINDCGWSVNWLNSFQPQTFCRECTEKREINAKNAALVGLTLQDTIDMSGQFTREIAKCPQWSPDHVTEATCEDTPWLKSTRQVLRDCAIQILVNMANECDALDRLIHAAQTELEKSAIRRCALLLEEAIETCLALMRDDIVSFLDGLADTQYVLSGMAWTYNMPLSQAFVIVHQANMEKLPSDGPSRVREKGADWVSPNQRLKELLERVRSDSNNS